MVNKKGNQSSASVWPSLIGWVIGTAIWGGIVYLFLSWLSGWMVSSDVAIFRGLGILMAFLSIFIPYLISYRVGQAACLKELDRQESRGQNRLLSLGWANFAVLIRILWIPVFIFAVVNAVGAFNHSRTDNVRTQLSSEYSFVEYTGDGFTASFPEKPEVKSTEDGTLYTAIGRGSYTFAVQVYGMPPGYDDNEVLRQSVNQPDHTTISRNYNESVLGYPAASSVVSDKANSGEDVEYHNKFIVKDDKLYALSVYGYSHNNLKQYLNDFVSSLSFE